MQAGEPLFEGLEEFRQHLGGRLTLTMVPRLGTAIDVHEVDRSRMMIAIQRVADFACGDRRARSRSATRATP
jgi:3-dehydroquinate synthase